MTLRAFAEQSAMSIYPALHLLMSIDFHNVPMAPQY